MKKILLDSILDKWIIVVDGDEKRVVYDVDDSRIFSVHITGCGRGARNASLSHNTFKTLEEAEKGIKYLDTCYWKYKFKAIKVSDLKSFSEKGFNYLVEDIETFNRFLTYKEDTARLKAEEEEFKNKMLKQIAFKIIESSTVYHIEDEGEGYFIIRCHK